MTAHVQQHTTHRTGSARRIAAIVLAGFMGVLLLIQFVPYGRDHTNPPVIAEPTWGQPANAHTLLPCLRRLSQQRNKVALVQQHRARLVADHP